ncbi:MAG: ATP-binding protein [Anaerosomatales bacterium]|uniref:PAS domain-containing sensor histidine kinase n=1 Tax=Parvivirga hydrogeniphila TaxID=2939460 RepID=UPI002260EE80|nr:ATP-binding protein [Parvivirga hydrogeniphila]MCL4079086.1 ATP-binding protein [Parvivirga hydrogeniphila]MDI6693389.1 ATP-binding protein [Anaerosomatales bacterium]
MAADGFTYDQWAQVLLDAAPIGISIGRPDGEIVFYNPRWERISGYTAEEVRERGWFELAYPDPEERVRAIEAAVAALSGGAPYVELEITRKDGRRIWAQFVTAPVVVDGKRYNFTFMADVTERRLAELRLASHKQDLERAVAARTAELEGLNETLAMVIDELRQANLAKDRFMRTVSHELRTPLNSVIGFSDILLRGLAGELGEEQRRQVEMIRDAGEHLLRVVEQVLEVAAIESGELQVDATEFDAGHLVSQIAEMLAPAASSKGLRVVTRLPTDPIVIESDPAKVRQVLLNLASNAVKFCERGEVAMSVARDGDSVRFAVADTGPGVDEAVREMLFDEFVQGLLPDGSRPDGVGLGLAIARRVAEVLGGTLELVETSVAGTTFVFTLPARYPSRSGKPGAV